jgi:hypothetical protein
MAERMKDPVAVPVLALNSFQATITQLLSCLTRQPQQITPHPLTKGIQQGTQTIALGSPRSSKASRH